MKSSMKTWGALITLALTLFLVVVDTTIMNVSITALVQDLNTTVSGVQAAISIYALVMAAFILIGSKLSDIFGKKRIFMLGLIFYMIGTTWASFSTNLAMLIIGWSILEGIGGALMLPNIPVLLQSNYKDGKLSFAYGIIGVVGTISAGMGPMIGSLFTTYASWRGAFLAGLLLALIIFALSRSLKQGKALEHKPKFDFLGAGLSIFGWSGIVLGILLAQTYGVFFATNPFMIGSYAFAPFGLSITPILVGAGFIIIILLFRWERHLEQAGKDGLFKPSIMQIDGMRAGLSVRAIQVGVSAAFLYIFPLMLQLSFSYTAIEAGFAMMPFSIGLLLFAIIGSKLSARFTAKRIIQVGFLMTFIGLIGVGSRIVPDINPAELLMGSFLGAGLGLIASQILNLILSSVSMKNISETSGLIGTFEQLGAAVGIALAGVIMLTVLSTSLENQISVHPSLPTEINAALITAVEDGVQLASNEQLEASLAALSISAEMETALFEIYHIARTDAFRAGIALLIYSTLLGSIFALGLPNRKLLDKKT